MTLKVVEHPLVADRVAMLRNRDTDRAQFRRALSDLTTMLLYEASRKLPSRKGSVETPLASAQTETIAVSPCLVPITRAGLGMVEPALGLFPSAHVAYVGLKKDEQTFEPRPYLNTVPPDLAGREAFVLDPMIATGGSAALACAYLEDAGAGSITVVSAIVASDGISALEKASPSTVVVAGALDTELNSVAFIVPGLGDAGDRQFGDYYYGQLSREDVRT